MADKIRAQLVNKIGNFLKNKNNVRVLILLVGSGVLVGAALNVALDFPIYNMGGILGALVAIIIVHSMA